MSRKKKSRPSAAAVKRATERKLRKARKNGTAPKAQAKATVRPGTVEKATKEQILCGQLIQANNELEAMHKKLATVEARNVQLTTILNDVQKEVSAFRSNHANKRSQAINEITVAAFESVGLRHGDQITDNQPSLGINGEFHIIRGGALNQVGPKPAAKKPKATVVEEDDEIEEFDEEVENSDEYVAEDDDLEDEEDLDTEDEDEDDEMSVEELEALLAKKKSAAKKG